MEENTKQLVNQPTYEELKNYCDQLLMQRNRIAAELQQVSAIVNKLPWLFKVIKYSHYFDDTFVDSCLTEIVEIMTPNKEEPKAENNTTTTEK